MMCEGSTLKGIKEKSRYALVIKYFIYDSLSNYEVLYKYLLVVLMINISLGTEYRYLFCPRT